MCHELKAHSQLNDESPDLSIGGHGCRELKIFLIHLHFILKPVKGPW